MILSGTLISLQAVLAGAVATAQPECHVAYVDYNKDGAETPPAEQRSALNNTTDVTILDAPPFNPTREVRSLNLYNKDTATVTVTIKTDDGTTERILIKIALLTLETMGWEKGRGWFVLDANGNLKEVTGSLFSSLTVTGGFTVGGSIVSTLGNNQALFYSNTATTGYQFIQFTNTSGDAIFGVQGNSTALGGTGSSNYDTVLRGQAGVSISADGGTNTQLRVSSSGVSVTGTLAVSSYLQGAEETAPAAPAANGYRIFAQDNGAGKTQLMVIFSSGAAQQLAIQP